MPTSKNNKKNRSHKVWRKEQNLKNKSKRDENWIGSKRRICKGWSNKGMIGKRFADYK